MAEVWKYEFNFGENIKHIPITGRGILYAGEDFRMKNCFWVEVDPERNPVPVTVIAIGTGQPIPDDEKFRFIGTVPYGSQRWHVYARWQDG